MATVLQGRPSGSNKRFRFAPSVNMNGYTQKEVRRKAALDIILDARYEDRLVGLTGRSRRALMTLIAIDDDFVDRRDVDHPNDNRENRETRYYLKKFRNSGKSTLRSLSNEDSCMIDALVGVNAFHEAFPGLIPGTVVSSSESTPDRVGQPPRDQTRRDEEHQLEKDAAEIFRELGVMDNDGIANPPQIARMVDDNDDDEDGQRDRSDAPNLRGEGAND